MSRISSCATCHGDLLIPGSVDPLDSMRCPLCHAEFQVQDVLEGSILAPPEALPIGRVRPEVVGSLEPGASLDSDAPTLTLDDQPQRAVRSRRKGPGMISHLIGVFGGGLIGLSIGYLGLLKFGGVQYDVLKIADRLPAWAVAKAKQPANDQKPRGRNLQELLDAPDAPAAPAMLPDAPAAMPGNFPAGPVPAAPPSSDAGPSASAAPMPVAVPDSSNQDVVLSQAATGEIAATSIPTSAPEPENPRLGPRDISSFTADQLTKAAANANASLACPACRSTGYVTRSVPTVTATAAQPAFERRVVCDVCNGKRVAKLTPETYPRLCELAEIVTFVDNQQGSPEALAAAGEQTQSLLTAIASDPRAAETMGRLAGYQLEQVDRKQSGIALAGTVQHLGHDGELYLIRVVLFGLPKVVTVASWRPPQAGLREHDRVVILGSIVNDPAQNLVGYSGQLSQVVWGGMPVRLPSAP